MQSPRLPQRPGRIDHATERLRLVVVCAPCEKEVRELGATVYRPHFETPGPQLLPPAV